MMDDKTRLKIEQADKILKKIKDYDWNKYNRDVEIYKSEYQAAIY